MISTRPLLLLLTLSVTSFTGNAFAPAQELSMKQFSTRVFAKKPDFDLSSIETRDMTREEMLDLNKKNEEIMNMELQMMTGFSLAISLPILYLCWVAFFSD